MTAKLPPQIGSIRWLRYTPHWATRGVADCVLRLFEQRVISRERTLELIRSLAFDDIHDVERVPWDKLMFNEAEDGPR